MRSMLVTLLSVLYFKFEIPIHQEIEFFPLFGCFSLEYEIPDAAAVVFAATGTGWAGSNPRAVQRCRETQHLGFLEASSCKCKSHSMSLLSQTQY